MKNNIMIIVLVTLVALGVIVTVIIAGVANSSEEQPSESPNSSGYVSAEDPYSDSGSGIISDPASDPWYSSSDNSSGSSNSGHTIGDEIVSTARSILDRDEKVPFLDNGTTLEGFDNSGFIYYVLRENGFLTCPRRLQEQCSMGRNLKFNELKRGDLVFFCNEDDTEKVGYGGIYTGEGTMIACLMPGTYVEEIDISDKYYSEYFYCGVSLS